jgi:hypothetical protein
MPCLVPQDAHEPIDVAALDLTRHLALQAHQAGVRQIEWHRDARHTVGRKPFLRQPDVGPEPNAALIELAVEPIDVALERRAVQIELQVAHAQPQQLFIAQARPRELARPEGRPTARIQEARGHRQTLTNRRGAVRSEHTGQRPGQQTFGYLLD